MDEFKAKHELIEKTAFAVLPIMFTCVVYLMSALNTLNHEVTVLNNKISLVVTSDNKQASNTGAELAREKLRQDLTCKWFIRNDDVYFDSKLEKISDELKSFKHFDNDYLLILMLLRVLPYANKTDQDYLISEIYKLWK